MNSGKFLVTRLGMFPQNKFFNDLKGVKKFVGGWEKKDYRIYRVGKDGLIRGCGLAG
jgi:hypothetical protein